MEYEVGALIEGKITRIAPYGAFVTMDDGRTGLIHISEVCAGFVRDIKEHLHEGDTVSAKIIGIDPKGKLSLSIKQMRSDEKRTVPVEFSEKKHEDSSFEDMMSRFMSASNDKLSDLKARGEVQVKRRRRE